MFRALGRPLGWLARAALGLVVVAMLSAGGTYGLALMALHYGQLLPGDVPQGSAEYSPFTKALFAQLGYLDGSARATDLSASGTAVTLGPEAAARVSATGRADMLIRGHGAALVSVRLVGDGRAMVSVDAAGGVRLTDVGKAGVVPDAVDAGLLARLGDRFWLSYGRPLAQLSLAAVSRFRPLVFRDCDSCPAMAVIPPGRFLMGSPANEKNRFDNEGPQHEVRLEHAFAVAQHTVTRADFAAFVAATGDGTQEADHCNAESETGKADWENRPGRGWRVPGYGQTDAHPVVCVSWEQAKAYAAWMSARTGYTYRLLSEAEWEYAARAGTTTRFSFGDAERDLCGYANGADVAAKRIYDKQNWTFAECDDGFVYSAPVGSFKPNAFGLYDMHGNVLQWVEDCHVDNYNDAPTDGSARTTGECVSRVLRGGSWLNDPQNLRSANRSNGRPDNRSGYIGFRLARTLLPSP